MTSAPIIDIVRLEHAPQDLPAYATPGSAGMDIRAAITEPIELPPMERKLIPTGLIICLPQGLECQIRPRSGLSIKFGITLVNAVGTIDSDYRHEIMVPLINLSQKNYTLMPLERIAQLVIAPVLSVSWQEVAFAELVSGRSGGFGSTGKL